MIYYVHSKGLPFGILSKVYYYVHLKACNVRSKVFSGLADVRGKFEGKWSTLSAEKLVVVSSNGFAWIFGGLRP